MRPTLNQIRQKLSDIAAAHLQINSFESGELWEIGSSDGNNPLPVVFPQLWMNVTPAAMDTRVLVMQFQLLIMDLVSKDMSNEFEVQSDTLQTIVDVVAKLRDPEWLNEYNIVIDEGVTLEPFTEKFDDEVTGWIATVNVRIPNTQDRCAVPETSNEYWVDENGIFIVDESGNKITTT